MLCFAYHYSRLSPFYCYRFFNQFNDNRQTCLRDGKTLKVVLCTAEFCPLCDKQVIASSLGQLVINFTCIYFQSFPNCLRRGNFVKTFKIPLKLILNCPQAHAITYTATDKDLKGFKHKLCSAECQYTLTFCKPTHISSRLMIKNLSVMMPLGLKIKLALKRLFRLITLSILVIQQDASTSVGCYLPASSKRCISILV